MSETPIPPASPSKEVATTSNTLNTKKFEDDGVVFKGKLIGMEELSIDRDEKICLDSMFKLKAVVRARGGHKQKVQFHLTMTAVKIIDDITKASIASHEIERISFVVIDPRDTRAFGYIFNTTDDHHQFWAIKTERAAAATVLALKELFELAFEQFTSVEQAKLAANKSTTPIPPLNQPVSTPVSPLNQPVSTPVSPLNQPVSTPVSSLNQPVSTSVSPLNQPVSKQEPSSNILDSPLPSASVPIVPTLTEKQSLIDDNPWVESSTTTVKQTTDTVEIDLWGDVDAHLEPPKEIDPLEALFSGLSTSPSSPSTNTNNELLDLIPNVAPPPVNHYTSFPPRTVNVNLFNANSTLPQQQQQQQSLASRPAPPPPQQQDLVGRTSFSPVAPPTVTNPFTGFDILGDLSSGTTTKTKKDAFFPPPPPSKTIQQLQMEKQS